MAVEAAARRIWRVHAGGLHIGWDELDLTLQAHWRTVAHEALSAATRADRAHGTPGVDVPPVAG